MKYPFQIIDRISWISIERRKYLETIRQPELQNQHSTDQPRAHHYTYGGPTWTYQKPPHPQAKHASSYVNIPLRFM